MSHDEKFATRTMGAVAQSLAELDELRPLAARMRELDALRAERDTEKKRAIHAEAAAAQLRDLMRQVDDVTADARRWREAVEGVGDVERYARVAWEARHGSDFRIQVSSVRDQYQAEARAILAAFRARALSDGAAAHAAVESAKPGPWGARDIVRAALDYACSHVAKPCGCDACRDGRADCCQQQKPAFVPVDVSKVVETAGLTRLNEYEFALLDVVLELARRENERGGRNG